MPAVCGIFALQDFVSGVMFAPEYFRGNIVMGPVALGMLFLAITEYSIKGWELNSMTKQIFYRSLIGGIVNIVINVLLVPYFGMLCAAISTFIGFFILARYGTRKLMKFRVPPICLIRIVGSGLIMAAVLIIIKTVLPRNIAALGASVLIGIGVYFILMYVSGEMKDEINSILRKILKRNVG